MDFDLDHLIQEDINVMLHPASSIEALAASGPTMITSAEGCFIETAEGQKLLDGVAGLWCVNAGYGRKELATAMSDAALKLSYYHSFSNVSNPWQVALAEKILSHAPDNMGKVFFGSSGSDCNDTLIKIAWHYHNLLGNPEKVKVIAREQAYHGTSISTASLTGLTGFHKSYPIPMDFVIRTSCPHYYTRAFDNESETEFCDRMIDDVAKLIEAEGANTIAAFFAEPIFGAGGVIEPPEHYYPKLKALLQQHNILLVADEVICGYGRLGSWFGSPELGLVPDMMASAKGLTSGYFPLSAALISDQIWEVLKDQGSKQVGAFMHGYTYSGHPVGAAVGLANLSLIEDENLVQRAKENGAYLHQQLQSLLNFPSVGEIRGRGLIAGIQLVTNKQQRTLPEPAQKLPQKIADLVRSKGVIVRPLPTVGSIAISPPLTISKAEIDQLVATVSEAISETR